MAAWEAFVTGETVARPDPVRSVIESSWRRCQNVSVDCRLDKAPQPMSEDSLESLREQSREILSAGEPVMAMARDFLLETGTVMVLTDVQGVILRLEGDRKRGLRDAIADVRFVPGATWTESACGTNAVGTALATGRPVQVHGEEHFCEGIKRWTCSATVVRDPFDGALLGCVDISGLRGAYSRHSMALVAAAASGIENQLAQIESARRYRLLDRCLQRLPAAHGDHVVILDRKGRIVRANGEMPAILRALSGKDGAPPDRLDRADWVRPEWLTSIYDGRELLGSLLVAPKPRSARSSRRQVEGPQPSKAFVEIVGDAPAQRTAIARMKRVAATCAPVLLLGETGVGKELFARSLHQASACAGGPFIALNCGGLNRDLLTSELFGYAGGAFTGARPDGMAGKIEAAANGTLFLDEIGEMPADLQPMLLRVLEEREVCRLGETRPRPVDFRLVAATNRDLRAEIERGGFRADLYYRIAVVSITIPPLRERMEQLPELVDHFCRQAARRYGVPLRRFSTGAMDRLASHRWPGNVRELRNVVESALLTAAEDTITEADLPDDFALPSPVQALPAPPGLTPIERAERDAIRDAIEAHGGNLTASARTLGVSKSTLYAKLHRYALDRGGTAAAFRPAFENRTPGSPPTVRFSAGSG